MRPNGDCTFRYDFKDAMAPQPTNFVIGTRVGMNVVNALAILGTNVLSSTVWRIDDTPVTNGVFLADILCTNGVTRAGSSYTEHADYARLWMESAVPTVVSRGTNEVWTWSVSRIDGHTLPSPVVVAANGPSVAYSILAAPVAPWTDSTITNQNVWASHCEEFETRCGTMYMSPCGHQGGLTWQPTSCLNLMRRSSNRLCPTSHEAR